MAHQIALLLPHLGGKAYSLRSAIVHAIGSLLHKAFDRWGRRAGNMALQGLGRQPHGAMMRRTHLAVHDALCLPHTRTHFPALPCCSTAVVDAADAQGAQARLRSKQLLLDMLVERIRHALACCRLLLQ